MRKKLTVFKNNNKYYIIDDSLFTFYDRSPSLMKEKKLKSGKNVEIVDALENEGTRWDSNSKAVGLLEKRYNILFNEDKELSFLGRYLAHANVLNLSFLIYRIKILAKYNASNKSQKKKLHKFQVKSDIFTFIKSGIYSFLFLFVLNIVLVLKTLSKYSFVFTRSKRTKATIGVDLLYCNFFDQNQQILTGARSDAFLLNTKSNININNLIFLNEGWVCSKEVIRNIENNDIPIKIAGSLYDKKLPIIVFLKILGRINYKYLCESVNLVRKKIPLNFQEQFHRSFFHARKVIPYILFNSINIRAYLSRMDYSEIHHCYASVCHDLDISFHGISHSSSGGIGHVPQMSFVSFDYYYVNSKSFVEKYYGTWENRHTKLISLGPWRADFIKDVSESSVQNLRSKFVTGSIKYVIGIHLPVPESYLFNNETLSKWMRCFYKILTLHSDCYFILFSRSDLKGNRAEKNRHNKIYNDYIKMIENTGRGSLSSNHTDPSGGNYIWARALDLVVGCTFSDSVLESWVSGTPACSYSDIGRGRAYLDSVDTNLRLYDYKSIDNLLCSFKKMEWPSKSIQNNLKELFGSKYYGNSISIMLENIQSSIQ
jgi:hypothetical protein